MPKRYSPLSTSSACPHGQPTQSEIQVKGKELSSQRAPGPDNPDAPFSRLCLFVRHVEFLRKYSSWELAHERNGFS